MTKHVPTTLCYNVSEFCSVIPLEFLWVLLEFEYSEAGIPVGIFLIIYSHFLSSTEPKFRQESNRIPVGIADSAQNLLEDVGECKDLEKLNMSTRNSKFTCGSSV